MQRARFILLACLFTAGLFVRPAIAQPYDSTSGDPAVLDQAMKAVLASLAQVATQQGGTFTTAFTVDPGAAPPPPPANGFTSPLTQAPAAPVMSAGFLRVQTEDMSPFQLQPALPGDDWSAQVEARVVSYQLGTSAGWQAPLYVIRFMKWTVHSAGGTVSVEIRPPNTPQADGIPDGGLESVLAAVFSIPVTAVHLSLPQ